MPARAGPSSEGALAELARLVLAMRPDELEQFVLTLAPDDLALVEQIVADTAAEGWRSDPATMAAFLDPAHFRAYRYVRYLSTKFKDAAEGRSKRQLWALPARYGKSWTASQWGPVWVLDRKPEARFILVSYGQSLAVENALGIRDRLTLHSDVLRCSLRRDRRRADRFVTDAGGGVVAAGISGVVRGFGAGAGGGLIVDDPFKNWQEAHSEVQRDHVWNQYRGTLLDRLDDEEAFIIIVGHRVHMDDLAGRLLADQEKGGEQWEYIRLPALADEADPLGRAPGEALEPERFSAAFIEQQARAMGTYLFDALQMQNPKPEEGNDILRAWFRLWGTEQDPGPTAPDESLTSWDLKLKDREQGDYVVGQVWWRVGADYYLRDQIRGQFDHATTANAIALLSVRHPGVGAHAIEAAGSADEVVPLLREARPDYVVDEAMVVRLGMTEHERAQVQALRRRGMPGLIFHPVTEGSKPVRVRTFVVPYAEAGNIWLPAYAAWLPAFLDEAAAFPKGANDDQIDTMSQALQRLTRSGASITPPTRRVPTPTPGTTPTVVRPARQGASLTRPVRRGGRRW